MHTPPAHIQIAVIGAGPVGVLTALALQRQGKQVLLIEARPQHSVIRDKRTLALSFNSVAAFAKESNAAARSPRFR